MKREPSYCLWECNVETVWKFLYKLKIESYDPAVPQLGIYLKKMKTLI